MRTRVADTHDPNRAAHPLRIAAYALHPVGVTLDWVIVRPAVWVAKQRALPDDLRLRGLIPVPSSL